MMRCQRRGDDQSQDVEECPDRERPERKLPHAHGARIEERGMAREGDGHVNRFALTDKDQVPSLPRLDAGDGIAQVFSVEYLLEFERVELVPRADTALEAGTIGKNIGCRDGAVDIVPHDPIRATGRRSLEHLKSGFEFADFDPIHHALHDRPPGQDHGQYNQES